MFDHRQIRRTLRNASGRIGRTGGPVDRGVKQSQAVVSQTRERSVVQREPHTPRGSRGNTGRIQRRSFLHAHNDGPRPTNFLIGELRSRENMREESVEFHFLNLTQGLGD